MPDFFKILQAAKDNDIITQKLYERDYEKIARYYYFFDWYK